MMSRLISMGVIAAAVAFSPAAMADQVVGTVDEVAGGLGDFVVMRDGVAYSLRSGDAVRIGDILRAKYPGSSITFNLSGEAGERDIVCEVQATEEVTVTEAAGEQVVCKDVLAGSQPPATVTAEAAPAATTPAAPTTTGAAGGGAGAPLIIGGIVVAAGGIAAAAGGGGDDGPTSP